MRPTACPTRRSIRRLALTLSLVAVALLAVLILNPSGLLAQQGPGASLGSQSMRPYRHVFWAYALAWALILGWVISLGRRWSRVEDDLDLPAGE